MFEIQASCSKKSTMFSVHTKLTSVAKGIIKICKQEMNEIETCPECYLKANTHNDTNWFLEVCSHPHMLVWAKLKGNFAFIFTELFPFVSKIILCI